MADREIKLRVTIENDQAKRAADDAAKAQKKIEDAAKRSNKVQQEGHDAAAKGFTLSNALGKQFGDVLGSIASQMTLLSVGQKVIDAIADSFASARKAAQEGVDFNKQYRESLLEIAALKGNLGAVTAEMREQVKFRQKTLQTASQANAFQGEYLNVGNVNVGKSISPDDYKSVMEQAGKFQRVEGGDATVHGRLAGVAPAMMGTKPGGGMWTADEVMANNKATFNQMQYGSFKFSSGAKQLMQSQGLLAEGGFKDSREMAGMLTALSNQGDPETSATSLRQLNTALMGSAKKMRSPLMDGDTMKTAAYYKSINYKDGMTNAQIMKLVHDDILEQEKKNPKFQLGPYLQSKGFGSEQSIEAIGMAHRSMTLGQWDPHMARAVSATGMNPEDENDPLRPSYDQRMTAWEHSQHAVSARSDVSADARRINQGLKIGSYADLKSQAFDSLSGQGKIHGEYSKWKDDYRWGGVDKLDTEIMDAMKSEARRVGIDVKEGGTKNRPTMNIGGHEIESYKLGGLYDDQKARVLGPAQTLIESKGGNVSDELLRRTVTTMERVAKATEAIEKAQTPPTAPPPNPAKAPATGRRP